MKVESRERQREFFAWHRAGPERGPVAANYGDADFAFERHVRLRGSLNGHTGPRQYMSLPNLPPNSRAADTARRPRHRDWPVQSTRGITSVQVSAIRGPRGDFSTPANKRSRCSDNVRLYLLVNIVERLWNEFSTTFGDFCCRTRRRREIRPESVFGGHVRR